MKLGYYAYKNAHKLPFKLVTGTTWECEGVRPSDLERLPVSFGLIAIDEKGKKDEYWIKPFKVFG